MLFTISGSRNNEVNFQFECICLDMKASNSLATFNEISNFRDKGKRLNDPVSSGGFIVTCQKTQERLMSEESANF